MCSSKPLYPGESLGKTESLNVLLRFKFFFKQDRGLHVLRATMLLILYNPLSGICHKTPIIGLDF
jgi:hypothetical protein